MAGLGGMAGLAPLDPPLLRATPAYAGCQAAGDVQEKMPKI